MRNIVISMQNRLLAESISRMLEANGEFLVYRSVAGNQNRLTTDCSIHAAEILMMEVSHGGNMTLQARKEEIKQVKKQNPNCKVILLCDENTAPDLAREVVQAKKADDVDAFLYSSVSANYLMAVLASL